MNTTFGGWNPIQGIGDGWKPGIIRDEGAQQNEKPFMPSPSLPVQIEDAPASKEDTGLIGKLINLVA